MKKSYFIIGGILLVIVILIIVGVSINNSLVGASEDVRLRKGNIQTVLQERADLIPNLVSTVKGYATHEETVFTDIANARSALAGAAQSGDVSDMSNASGQLDSALSRLLVIVENYPELKASQAFIGLQDELSGIENRLRVARERYNEAVSEYNRKIQMFPTSLFASMGGHTVAPYFEASDASQNAPQVDF